MALRLGIDVGGTFTDVIALDAATRQLVARVKVPTTHDAPEGVAAGIVEGIERVMTDYALDAAEIVFIAHSTTQATNALLEGDVARVGVLGLVRAGSWLARRQMRFSRVELAPGVWFDPEFRFAAAGDAAAVREGVDALIAAGAQAVAASEPFGVDRPAAEQLAVTHAQGRRAFATSGHDISSTYGLRARTRTAALNAAILPKMVRTARMTAQAVERASIAAPLMIMRSDGGVMDVREIERRPILTLLSGPAAGVAGALLYENVTDGIFIEVGGTSSDCSAIRGGHPQLRPARVGGMRTMLRTVDSRTLGVAGGSMPRVDGEAIVDVGPRSAHIAGCRYASFVAADAFDGAVVERFAPSGHDPKDYVRIVLRDGTFATVTPTCAGNLLGYVPEDAFARGDVEAARRAFELVGAFTGMDGRVFARRMLEIAGAKIVACVDELMRDYSLEPDQVVLVGGGGGAASLVPFAAESSGLPFRIARDAEVISPVGVALALVRDVVERTIVDPAPEDIVRIRREASDRVIAAGAAPDRIEISIEIDTQRNRLRATAQGATALAQSVRHAEFGEAAQRAAAARSLRVEPSALVRIDLTGALAGYMAGSNLRVVDERAVVRAALRGARVKRTTAGALHEDLRTAMEEATAFGDVGRSLPETYVLHGARLADFSGLANIDQAIALAREELSGRTSHDAAAILTVPRRA